MFDPGRMELTNILYIKILRSFCCEPQSEADRLVGRGDRKLISDLRRQHLDVCRFAQRWVEIGWVYSIYLGIWMGLFLQLLHAILLPCCTAYR